MDDLKNKRLGAILGAAIGDAMGHPTEFMSVERIRQEWPPNGVEGFELWWERADKRFAPYTDDTQMAEVVLRSVLRAQKEDFSEETLMKLIARGFVDWSINPQGGHRAPGGACMAGCHALAGGTDWQVAGGETAGGCGSVMRCYPFGLFYDPDEAERLAILHSHMTHRDPIALAACAAMARGVALNLRDEPVATVIEEMIRAANTQDHKTARMMLHALVAATDNTEPDEVLDEFRGWAAHEAIAAAVYLFARNDNDPRVAILEGANSSGDSDSLATLAGALVGSRVGLEALPENWVRDVERSEVFLGILDG